jgi:hypothetical protein
MHKSATKCNETLGKWCKNKHGASKIMDTLETYHSSSVFIISCVDVRLTGEFTSLEEPMDDPDVVILSVLLADGPNFVGSERRVEPEGPM